MILHHHEIKLLGFLWALIVLRWLQIYSCFDFMMSLSDDKQVGITEAFNTTSRYLDDILH